jgi:hypothetical protein
VSRIGTEPLRGWAKQAEIDAGVQPRMTQEQAERMHQLEPEKGELPRANGSGIRRWVGPADSADAPASLGLLCGRGSTAHRTAGVLHINDHRAERGVFAASEHRGGRFWIRWAFCHRAGTTDYAQVATQRYAILGP